MKQCNRACRQIKHEKYFSQHICTLKECRLPTRWCCAECIKKEIHRHNMEDQSHIMNQIEFQEKYNQDYQYQDEYSNQYSNLLQQLLKECQKLETNIKDYKQYLVNQLDNFIQIQDQQQIKQQINQFIDDNFIILDDDKINQIINRNSNKINIQNTQQLQYPLNNIKEQLKQLKIVLKQYQENMNFVNCAKDLSKTKYTIKQIDQTNSNYLSSQISNNEQYLAYGGYDKVLKIYEIEQNKMVQEINLDQNIYVCQFTNDSSLLCVGCSEGFVYVFDTIKEFKEIYKQQIHQHSVCNIRTIRNQYFITCSYDKTIIKTDIMKKKQIFQLIGHNDWISAIDYDPVNDMMISGSHDKSIKLWDCKNLSITINQPLSSIVRQLQYINNHSNLLSLDLSNNLFQWSIDLIYNKIIKIKEFNDPNKIFNFYSINNNQNLIQICGKYIKILNDQEETIITLHHQAEDFLIYECRQLNNGRYIQIRTASIIISQSRIYSISYSGKLIQMEN